MDSLELSDRLNLSKFVADFTRSLIFVITTSNLLIVLNFLKGEIECILKLEGFRTRMSYLPETGRLAFIDRRSEVTFLKYQNKMFFVTFKIDFGLMHLKSISEMWKNHFLFLDREGELIFYRFKNSKLKLLRRLKPLQDQAIKDSLFIFSVLFIFILKLKFLICVNYKKKFLLFWCSSPTIYRFNTAIKETSMRRFTGHHHEVRHVSYSKNLEKVISCDLGFRVIVWDLYSFNTSQVLIFESSVERIFPLQNRCSLLTLGAESYWLEKVSLQDHLGQFFLWDVVYDQILKKIVVITNHDVRFRDYVDGHLERVQIHRNEEIYADPRFFYSCRSKHKNHSFFAMTQDFQFCRFNAKTMGLETRIHAPNESEDDVPTAFYFIKEVDLFVVGYKSSKIKSNFFNFLD